MEVFLILNMICEMCRMKFGSVRLANMVWEY